MLMLNIYMNSDNNNPQTVDPSIQKLQDDLQKITNEAASTIQSQPGSPTESIPQPTSPVLPQVSSQPIETPPPTPNVPVDNGKKGFSLMTVAMILLIVAVVVAVGYVAYAKFMTPAAPIVQTPVQTMIPMITPQATDSGVPTMIPSVSPSAVPAASSSSTPLATP